MSKMEMNHSEDVDHRVAPENQHQHSPSTTVLPLEEDLSPDMELLVVSSLTATLSEEHNKTGRLHWPPLPVNPDSGCILFPRWIAVSIVLLAIVGILGAIFELRYQYHL